MRLIHSTQRIHPRANILGLDADKLFTFNFYLTSKGILEECMLTSNTSTTKPCWPLANVVTCCINGFNDAELGRVIEEKVLAII